VEATDLWHALYTGAHGLLELPVIPGRAHAERLFLPVGNQRAHADAPAFARWYDGRGIVTFGVQPRRRKGGEKRDVLAVVALTVDMDCPDEATRDSAREKLEAFRLPYSALVSSGHGLHAYWLLGAPLPVQGPAGPANAARYESVAQRLARRLGADHTWDLPRVLRVPGSLNGKPGRPAVRSQLLELAPGVRYDLARFAAALPPQPRKDLSGLRGFRLSRSLSPQTEGLIREGNDGTYPSRSEADFAVACYLVRAGHTDAEIASVFAQHPRGIGQKYEARGDPYLRCVIRGARQSVGAAS